MKDLINWQELSRILAGNDDSIRRNKIPKKYEDDVDLLLFTLGKWNDKIKSDKICNDLLNEDL